METITPILLDNGFVKMPYLSVSPLKTTIYHKMLTPDLRDYNPLRGKKPECDNTQKGDISKKGKKALEKAVYWFLYSVDPRLLTSGKGKNKIQFITLTLPSKQVHSDKIIKSKALNQFLTEIREKYGVKKYIWKAEKQQNANIHFHILTDQFIPYQDLNGIWNRIMAKMGYVWEYSQRMKKMTENDYLCMRVANAKRNDQGVNISKYRKAYEKGCAENWMQPNSTDIENLRGVKNIAAYISKYMSKGHETKEGVVLEIIGRVWYGSQQISKMKNLQLDGTDNLVMDEFTCMLKKAKQKDIHETDYSITVSAPVQFMKRWGYKVIPDRFLDHCKEIFQGVKQQVLTPIVEVVQEVKEEIKEEITEILIPVQLALNI